MAYLKRELMYENKMLWYLKYCFASFTLSTNEIPTTVCPSVITESNEGLGLRLQGQNCREIFVTQSWRQQKETVGND